MLVGTQERRRKPEPKAVLETRASSDTGVERTFPEEVTMKKAVLITASLVFLLSCEQQEGERCQVDGDCASGMICCKPVAATPTSSGVCKPATECAESDASTDPVQDPAADPADVQDALPDEVSDEPTDPAAEDAAPEDTAPEDEPAGDADQEG
jgi:hypothetical protein